MHYAFGDYELDTNLYELRHAGQPCKLEPQVFNVLRYLIEHHDRVVTKDELLEQLWPNQFISEVTLNHRVMVARKAIGDSGREQRCIKTLHGRGYRFIAEVCTVKAAGEPPALGPAGLALPTALSQEAGSILRAHEGQSQPFAAHETDAAARAPEEHVEQRIRFCTTPDGVRIAYATSGSGPPLLKPANWLTHLEYDWESPVWRHWLRELSRDHTLIRYDARGSGLSDWEVADVSFAAWVRDLETLVDELGLERFPLVALSQGCAVALTYAAMHPERVSRLVLYGGFAQGRLRRAHTLEEREEAKLMIQTLPLGWGRDNPAFRQFFATMFVPDGTAEQHRWFSELSRVTTSPVNAVRLRTTSGEIDVTDMARRVKAPTLVLHATGDAVVPFDQGRTLAALVPGAGFVPIESRNHILLMDEPAWLRFVEQVRAFINEA